MKSEEVKQLLKLKTDRLASLCERTSGLPNETDIISIRRELKTVRSFLYMLRLNQSNSDYRLPSETRRIYSLAKTVATSRENIEKLQQAGGADPGAVKQYEQHILEAMSEWKPQQARQAIDKLTKVLFSINYSKIQPAVLVNFFNTHNGEQPNEEAVPHTEVHFED